MQSDRLCRSFRRGFDTAYFETHLGVDVLLLNTAQFAIQLEHLSVAVIKLFPKLMVLIGKKFDSRFNVADRYEECLRSLIVNTLGTSCSVCSLLEYSVFALKKCFFLLEDVLDSRIDVGKC